MPELPKFEGRYIARPSEWAVIESGENKLPTFGCSFDLLHFFGANGWEEASDLIIDGYFYLIKKDGQPNTNTIKSLRDALQWKGGVKDLAEGQWGDTEVQLTLGFEEYKGKSKIKVRFINPRDWEPTGLQNDPQVVQNLEQKYGSMLRALGGGTQSPAPGRPASPSKTPANGAVKPPEIPEKVAAWKEFLLKTSEMTDKSARAKLFSEAMVQFFGEGVEPSALAAQQWKTFGDAIKASYEYGNGFPLGKRHRELVTSPIGDEQEFKDDDIPF